MLDASSILADSTMDKEVFDSQEKIEIMNAELNYNKAKNFLHCKYCIDQFLGSELHEVMTPREYGMYEVSNYPFTYPGGEKVDIVVVWCKRCGRQVWDSRGLREVL